VRIVLLLIVGLIFLTGLVWWVLFIANAITGSLRKR
jgi:hypothetical protein